VRRKPIPPDLPRHVLDSAEQLDRLAASMARDDGPRVFLQQSVPDKYSCAPAPAIDCDNRVALCKAACCRLNVVLSPQDIQEGVVAWDSERPFLNAQDSSGYCVHLEGPACRCSVYAQRPVACRVYDCRYDPRIWIDFEKRIPNPALEALDRPPHPDRETNTRPESSIPQAQEEQEDANSKTHRQL
jgi:Putative zinc- or iron-chelating domain